MDEPGRGPTARFTRPVVLGLLFFSGFTGLVYELVWSKRLANLLGSSGHAHAIVLATFMGGLALGAFLFGRLSDRAKSPLMVYGLLELGVGAYALMFRHLLELLGTGWLSLGPSGSETTRNVGRLILAALTLLPPTLLMGGTVPALTRFFTQSLSTARGELSRLYAVNSLGAALGCLFAGVSLIPDDGLTRAELKAAVLNLCLGAVAVLLARRAAREPAAAVQPGAPVPEAAAQQYSAFAVKAALWGVALSGFTSMLYEITWIRLLSIVIGGTSYAFTMILTAFILGIGLGSAWLARRPDVDALKTFAQLQAALVLAVCVALPLYGRLPYLFIHLNAGLNRTPSSWPVYQLLTFTVCAVVLLPPTFLLGASFPAAARVAMNRVDQVGRQLGGVYLWNTIGTVTGSLLGGLVLLQVLGLEGNFLVGLALNLVAAGLAAWASKPSERAGRHFAPVAVALAVACVWAFGTAGWAGVVASSGRYREWERTFDSFASFREEVSKRSQVQFQRDDVFASVLVGQTPQGLKYMRVNGKIDASNGTDIDTQILAGHLGIVTQHQPVKKVLLVGMGSGVTAGSLLAHPIERLDLVEISQAVLDASRLFADDNGKALDDPRLHLHVDDAKSFLLQTQEQYDLIVSVPSNPWVSGVSGLFSRDFFQVAKSRLTPGGRIVQWFHTYESSDELVRMVVRTLRDTFEHGTSWVGPQDLVMIGSREPQVFDVEQIAKKMSEPRVAADLLRARTPDVVTLLGRQVHSDEGQKLFAGEGMINTDDHNLLEYRSAVAYFLGQFVNTRDERRPPTLGARLELTKHLAAHPLTAAQAQNLYRSYAWVHPPDDPLVRNAAEVWLELSPESLEAKLAVGKASWAQADAVGTVALLDPVIASGERDLELVRTWLEAKVRLSRRAATPFRPLPLNDALTVGREVAAAHPDDARLARAIAEAAGGSP